MAIQVKTYGYSSLVAFLLVAVSGCFNGAQDTESEDVGSGEAELTSKAKEKRSTGGGVVYLSKVNDDFGYIVANFRETTAISTDAPKDYDKRINSSCFVSFNTSFDAGTLTSAGTIRVFRETGSLLTTMEPQEADASVFYLFGPADRDSLWRNGERLTVRVSGSDRVPSFMAKIVAPEPIFLTSPLTPTSENDPPYTLQRDSDLKLTWTGGGKVGSVNVLIGEGAVGEASLEQKRITTVQCDFKPTSHEGIIPAAALKFLEKGDAHIQVMVRNMDMVERRGWRIGIAGQAGDTFVIPSIVQ